MSKSEYTSKKNLKKLYNDPDRIAARGEFLMKYSNRKYSVRDVLRMLMASEVKSRVVDYGCGNGSFLRTILKDRNIEHAYAIDIVQHHAVATLPEKVTYIDATNIFPDIGNSIDIVFCMNVLYHLPKRQIIDVLSWMGELLEDGGSLFLTTKSANNFPKFRELLDEMGLEYPRHADEIYFCKENARQQVEKALPHTDFTINEYPLSTQIITQDSDQVIKYMLSNSRFSKMLNHKTSIKAKLKESRLFIDTYYETIIHVRKTVYV